mmetsp:Transcript_18391/g.45943  ORF Transcript_18391/g.45943 Transcript_18391/m.45943 type:complete len:271 (+) Transcript_18391:642-1454(+)|eukprot:CAMPEP_0178996380 /NCGR_PEP_ID=MMETSP0795-20121207/8338_1 /TAXON_ID=88552 /ORGANISM="Amoebophrya sp., Strain Ameob2" /LENGTH=270 /DNA_ID=CAMNT_0020688767 /DNA_START=606 /DNA_END=1418 /DNA_ORIENTATION=+
MVGSAAPRNPLSRNIRNSPSLDDLNIIAKTQTRLPQVKMYDPLTFERQDGRARSLSAQRTTSSSSSKLKNKPFAGMKRNPQVNQAAFPRPNATKYDQSYLSAFADAPPGDKSSPSKGGRASSSRGAKPHIDTTGRGNPVTRDMASSLFDSATGLKLQMLKMVRDLNTNQDRSDAARDILRDLGSDPAKPHVDEKIFVNFYKSVQSMKEDVGAEIGEVRAEMRDIFAMLDSDKELMEDDIAEMEAEAVEMQRVVTKMNGAITKFEHELGRA